MLYFTRRYPAGDTRREPLEARVRPTWWTGYVVDWLRQEPTLVITPKTRAPRHCTYGYSLRHIRLQPPSHTVTASITYGCSHHHIRLQAKSIAALRAFYAPAIAAARATPVLYRLVT